MNIEGLQRALDTLREHKARGTVLVTYLIAVGRSFVEARARLVSELVASENIKSRVTRHAVLQALTNALTALGGFEPRIPPHGLAIFASEESAGAFEPPVPLTTNLYQCSNHYILGPLETMLESTEVFGLVVMDRKEATVGMLRGSTVEVLASFESRVMGKHSKGGQSTNRIARIIENEAHEFFVKVAETANRAFLGQSLMGIAVGGPGSTKDEWLKDTPLDYRLMAKLMPQTFTVGYTNDYGLRELSAAVQQAIPNLASARERTLLAAFLEAVRLGRAAYGPAQVAEAVAAGRVSRLLVSRGVALPDNYDGEVVLIGDEGEDAVTFKRGFGGVGAFLRW